MLSHQTQVAVRFNEADPLGIVWHGHYIRYFEDGREAFGKEYGVSYLDFYHQGLAVPVVSVHCDYKKPLRYGNTLVVETIYRPAAAAKLRFDYKMFELESMELVATGYSLQVFVDVKTFELHLINPPFFETWKKKWNQD
ncbi:MAG: acyl-CoA thioesterase [Cyclobacteriaceae bacterium]|nr:acyl-CoA thioesterase [Cyclobacteriaceae bacterium]